MLIEVDAQQAENELARLLRRWPLQRSIRLRPWQKTALERFRASTDPDFLAVATPGAGKTTFALTAAVLEFQHRRRPAPLPE